MSDETYAYFFIEGFECEADEISASLGLEPTDAWMKGEVSGKGVIRKNSCWLLYSQLPKSELFLDKHIEALVEILLPREKNILKLADKYDCGINCVGKFSPSSGIHLSKELLAKVTILTVPLDFDLYCK